jgi:hypothetical protein
MKRVLGAAVVLLLSSAPVWAQETGIKAGSLVLGGGSSVNFTRLSFGGGSGDGSGGTNNSSNIIMVQGAATFYKTARIGFGPIVLFQHFAFPSGGSDGTGTGISVSGGGFNVFSIGGLAKLRFELSKRADFYVQGEGGYGMLASANGYFVAGGAGVDMALVDRVMLNFGGLYQLTHIGGGNVTGLSAAVGISVRLK